MSGLKQLSANLKENPQLGVGGATGLAELAMNLFGKSGVHNDQRGNVMNTDLYGRPVFSSDNYEQSINALKESSRGEVLNSALGGAASGAKIGTMFGPLGAGIGAGVGAIGGLIGGKKRKREFDNEIESRKTKLNESVKGFNIDNMNYFDDVNADSINSYLMSQRAMRF